MTANLYEFLAILVPVVAAIAFLSLLAKALGWFLRIALLIIVVAGLVLLVQKAETIGFRGLGSHLQSSR